MRDLGRVKLSGGTFSQLTELRVYLYLLFVSMSTSAPASILLHELATLPLPAGGSSLAVAPRVAAPALAPGHQDISQSN